MGEMPDKPLPCEPLLSILRKKLKGERGIARKWIKCKIKEITGDVKARRKEQSTASGRKPSRSSGSSRDET